MGILASILFPRQFMSSQYSSSSASSSSSRSSSPRPDHPLLSERTPSPTPDSASFASSSRSYFSSPPLESHPFSTHSVGIGIFSPQPILGPLAPLTRASISPLHARSSPSQQRPNPFDYSPGRHLNSPAHSPSYRATDPVDDLQSSSTIASTSSPGPSNGAAGLRIALPPLHLSTSTSTPSPPLLPPPSIDPILSPHAAPLDPGASSTAVADVTYPSIESLQADFSLEFTEFDADGLSALEKIYLFSRSSAGFHRVFIVHALPRYLGADGASDAQYSSKEVMEQISPLEAIEYVLPLLNGLAMDDDESVKEALAAELVPIIWWFITHCRVVEDELQFASSGHIGPSSEAVPTPSEHGAQLSNDASPEELGGAMVPLPLISVQAFTPILGTLLLSQNTLVGGPARYAVVELLRRMRHADQDADIAAGVNQPPVESHSSVLVQDKDGAQYSRDVGMLGHDERRLFEREIVHQVVIGMGRLDMSDDSSQAWTDGQDELSGGDASTAVPTPMAGVQTQQDSYFPVPLSALPPTDGSPAGTQAGSFDAGSTAAATPLDVPTAVPDSPSPSASASSMLSTPSMSTPSLVSSSSSSSEASLPFDTPDLPTATPPAALTPGECVQPTMGTVPMDVDVSEWAPVSPSPTHAVSPVSSVAEDLESMAADMAQVPPDWMPVESDADEGDEGSLGEEAAVGRLSSMSLMAAVTASGSIRDDTREAFVAEVDRVGRDPVYWVRREATFAVGALAKVVPDEVVMSILLPLFDSLCRDPTWHVRHSVLYALPAILSRLPQQQRRALALDVTLRLACDESATVRSAVLEMLGEVMHTFVNVPEGPPQELLNLFMGIRDPALERPQSEPRPSPSHVPLFGSGESSSESGWSEYSGAEPAGETDIYDDPARPLVCAFNIPAVALTLGRARWPDLRELYSTLAESPAFKVRRTLAASLGAVAEIVGPEYARQDLLAVWDASVHAQETEVRLKAVECTAAFARVFDAVGRAEVVGALAERFSAGQLKGWREREEAARALAAFVEMDGVDARVLRRVLMAALEDNVAAVREAAMGVVPVFVRAWKAYPDLLSALVDDISGLARSGSFRKRTTFIACKQALLLSAEADTVVTDGSFWEALDALANDSIVDVRIRVARLLGLVFDKYSAEDVSVSLKAIVHAERLAQDSSHEVQAFARATLRRNIRPGTDAPSHAMRSAILFSRPPPAVPS